MRLDLLASSTSLPPPLPLMRNAIVLRNPAFVLLQALENVGMVMVFTLVSSVQDKLGEVLENFKKEKEEEIRRKEEQLKREEEVMRVHHEHNYNVTGFQSSCE